ncbi:hypothetical protein [Roseovarius sp. EL26]|uniref:hypothetical protein n=1 Tax=Roseovarius sp. EL26 TaxID=2126672 RepID=UPI000EA20B0D|nr:hypothetical protein [Roseovarius sp. EL26]
MKLFVDLAMLAVLAALGLEVIDLLFGILEADHIVLLDFLEMYDSEVPLPSWVGFGVITTALMTWFCLLCAFWPLHQIIRLKAFSFAAIGRMMKRSAYGSLGFWIGSTIMFTVYPLLIIGIWPTASNAHLEHLPLGFETIFLVLALTFLTVGKTLERAEAIEEENNQFL